MEHRLRHTRWPAWTAVLVVAVVFLVAHLNAFLAAGNLFNADAAIAGLQAFILAHQGVFPIFLADQSYMGMAPAWVAAGFEKLFGLHLWTITLAWGLFAAASFGILIDGIDRYVSRRAAFVFVLIAMFMALAPLNTLRPSGHVMGLLGSAILLRWILKYRNGRSLPVTAGSFFVIGLMVGFFWYSDEIVLSVLVPFIFLMGWAFVRRPRAGAALAGLGGLVLGYLPAILYRLEGGTIVLHTGITRLSALVAHVRIMLQAFSWGMFSVRYASHPVAMATGIVVLALSAAFLFGTPWETFFTRVLVIAPLYVNMVLFVASTMPIDMYDVRYLYPGLYTLGLTTAILVAERTRIWSLHSKLAVPAAMAALLAAVLYDGQSFVHSVSTAGPDAQITAARREAHWLEAHHATTGWGYYWDVYLVDLVGYPHLNFAANSNLNLMSVVTRAESYCRRDHGCPVILNAPPTAPLFQETPLQFSPKSVGTLQYTRLLEHQSTYFVYQAKEIVAGRS